MTVVGPFLLFPCLMAAEAGTAIIGTTCHSLRGLLDPRVGQRDQLAAIVHGMNGRVSTGDVHQGVLDRASRQSKTPLGQIEILRYACSFWGLCITPIGGPNSPPASRLVAASGWRVATVSGGIPWWGLLRESDQGPEDLERRTGWFHHRHT
ncbi:hypothetical protein R1flu_004404 [Riccia fluitans]|uniref:Secreted protein n=1 Tax=Riccia fluitans TaxID=41844 RepID=A0ABD1YQK3_9MARC